MAEPQPLLRRRPRRLQEGGFVPACLREVLPRKPEAAAPRRVAVPVSEYITLAQRLLDRYEPFWQYSRILSNRQPQQRKYRQRKEIRDEHISGPRTEVIEQRGIGGLFAKIHVIRVKPGIEDGNRRRVDVEDSKRTPDRAAPWPNEM